MTVKDRELARRDARLRCAYCRQALGAECIQSAAGFLFCSWDHLRAQDDRDEAEALAAAQRVRGEVA